MLSCLPTIPDAGGLVKAAAAVQPVYLPMNRDYEGDETRALAMELAAYLWFPNPMNRPVPVRARNTAVERRMFFLKAAK